MKIEELKEQAEDIQPVEEVSEEQKKQQEEFLLAITRRQFRSVLQAIKYRMDKGLTLEEIAQEIAEKRSPLSANQRMFVQGFKLDFIKQLLQQ